MLIRAKGVSKCNFIHSHFCKSIHNCAYEVKNNCCLFERLFKVKKNSVFLFGISFFILEIFTFLYFANEESDDIINCSTKTIIKNTDLRVSPEILEQ